MRILVTGVTGMDGSILSHNLIEQGEEVYGLVRRSASPNYWRIKDILDNPNFHLVEGDLTDLSSLCNAINKAQPEKIFHLAAQSFVPSSWEEPIYTVNVTGLGTLNVLEAIRTVNTGIKIYIASSSEMYGKVQETPQKETTIFYPRSPYGVAKVFGHYIAINYRESYNIFASCGILFNHEHEVRGRQFVTRKITSQAAKWFEDFSHNIKPEPIKLGNLDSKRDWGYAEDYVNAMQFMLDLDHPDTFHRLSSITIMVIIRRV